MLQSSQYRFLAMTSLIGLMLALLVGLPSQIAYSANCGGLPVSGGVIPPGTYTMTDNCTITASLAIMSGSVTINGGGFTISGGGLHRVFYVKYGATLNLENVAISDGINLNTVSVGGIFNDGTVIITDSIISSNTGGYGGGIYNVGTLKITNSTITGNSAIYGGGINNHGGIFKGGGTLTIMDSIITDNNANYGGGISSLNGTVTITNSIISDNSATFGGGINTSDDIVTITNSTVSGNSASFLGGGISSDGTINISCSRMENNTTGDPRHVDIDLDTYIPGSGLIVEYNWWGADTGPNTSGADTTNVIAISWLDAPDASPCSTPTSQVTQAVPATQVTPTDSDITVIVSPILEPTQPICNLISDITAYDLPNGFYCRVLMRDGEWRANPGTIPQELINNHVILAVDVFQLSGRQVDNDFGGHVPICLEGSGRLIFLDATTSPRVMVELETFAADGMTCGWVPNAGTLVLIQSG